MKNKFYAAIILLSTSFGLSAQTTQGTGADSWVPADTAGFGSYDRDETSNIIDFGSKLFVTSGNSDISMPHKLYYTTSGHPGSWLGTTGPWANSFDISNTAKTLDGVGYLYIGGSDAGQTNNGPVYRSTNGTTWGLYFLRTNTKVTNITNYKGNGGTDSTYIAYSDRKIYKGAIDANDPNNLAGKFRMALNVDLVAGILPSSNVVCSGIHSGKLYYGLDAGKFAPPQLIQTTDGVNFVLDTLFRTAVGYDTQNSAITAITSYKGELYIACRNESNGTQVLKSVNDTLWTVVKSYSWMYDRITDLFVANTNLYLSVHTSDQCGPGGLIEKFDSTSFSTSESGLFNMYGNFAEMGKFAIFNNHLYYASMNNPGNGCKKSNVNHKKGNGINWQYYYPGQVWRTCLSATPTTPTITFNTLPMGCPGATVTATVNAALSASTSYFWYNGLTTATSGPLTIPNSYYVSIIDTNNCANTSVVTTSAYPLPPAPIVNQSGTLCAGNNVSINLLNPNDQAAFDINGDGYGSAYSTDLTAQMNTSDSVTIELWFKAFASGVILSETDQYPYYWYDSQIEISPDDSLRVRVYGVNPVNLGKVNYNTWYHVALRYDKGLGKLDGFLNGVVSPNPVLGSRINPWSNGYPLYYRLGSYMSGGSTMGAGNASHCQVRDLRIWKTARTDVEISSNLNTNFAPATPGLAAYYKLNQAPGTTNVPDSSGNALDGYINAGGFYVAPATTNYSWSPATYLNTTVGANVVSTPAHSITYTITTTDLTYGCSSTSPLTVNIPSITFNGKSSICTPVDTAAYINLSGSYQTISWTPLTHNSSPSNAWDTLSPTVTTLYHVTAFDGVCTLKDSILIKVGPQISGVTLTPVKPNVCFMDSTDVSATPTGGTAPFTYDWFNQWSYHPYTGAIYNTGAATSTYSTNVNVTVTDTNGCSAMGLVSLNVISSTDLTGNITKQTGGLVTKGHVYLYPKNPGSSALNSVIPADTISATGDYIFYAVNAGDYWLKASADSLMYPNAMITYYGNAFRWDSSQVYTHGCSQVDTANIQVLETVPTVGPGVISGYIYEDPNYGMKMIGGGNHIFTPGGPIRGVDVKLGKNPGGGAAARTFSDSTGFYQFTNVAVGDYKIYVDIPNLPMDSLRDVSISVSDTSVHNDYWVDSAKIYIIPDTNAVTGIASHATSIESNFSIFPNPAKGLATLAYELKDNSPVLIEIYNVMGEKITSKYYGKQNAGKYTFPIDVNALEMRGGVYIVNLRINNKVSSQRIVVIE